MKLPFPAGNTLNDHTRILVNKYAHFSAPIFTTEIVEMVFMVLIVEKRPMEEGRPLR
jgi:hypothetical protein